MPIKCDFQFRSITRDEYHRIDYEVMGWVFELHNELGNLFNEAIYRNKLVQRCSEKGLEAAREVPIRVTFEAFTKNYFMDVVIHACIDYEFKAVERLADIHRKQALNYLFLAGLHYGKLVNTRPPIVEDEYVTTTLTPQDRFRFKILKESWLDLDPENIRFRELMEAMVSEWGVFLDVGLFYEVIHSFFGGKENVERQVTIRTGDHDWGQQKVNMLNPTTAFKITSMKKDLAAYETHLRKLLAFSSVKAIQWVNFKGRYVIFKTLRFD